MNLIIVALVLSCSHHVLLWFIPLYHFKVLRGHKRQDDLLNDYCDGSVYHLHPLFSKNNNALEIMLNYDDVEVCNPLGSRAKIHKLGINIVYAENCTCPFYFSGVLNYLFVVHSYILLRNITLMYRSSLKSIQLLAITKSSSLQKYGADAVLENFMKDIKQLESVRYNTFEIMGIGYSTCKYLRTYMQPRVYKGREYLTAL